MSFVKAPWVGPTDEAALEAILEPIADNSRRAGKPLVGELAGLWSARRGDCRIVHEILVGEQIVVVHRVQHRGAVCRPR